MLGAIIGDYIGSVYESAALNGKPIKGYNLPLFSRKSRLTDDTVLITATADALLYGKDFNEAYKVWHERYPDAGYGPGFSSWVTAPANTKGYSYGNGAAVRAGIIGYLNSEKEVLELASECAKGSHNHEEAIAGAQALAWTVWATRNKLSNSVILEELYRNYDYFCHYETNELHHSNSFDSSSINTVPIVIWVALNSKSFIDSVRMCLHIGGDTDTLAAMTGIISQQLHPIDDNLHYHLTSYLRLSHHDIYSTWEKFNSIYS